MYIHFHKKEEGSNEATVGVLWDSFLRYSFRCFRKMDRDSAVLASGGSWFPPLDREVLGLGGAEAGLP